MFFYGWEGTECISLKIRDWSRTLQIHVKKWCHELSKQWEAPTRNLAIEGLSEKSLRTVPALETVISVPYWFSSIWPHNPYQTHQCFVFFLKLQISLHMWRSGGRVGPFGTIGPRSHGDILFMGQFGSSESRFPLPLHYFRYLCFKKIVFCSYEFWNWF